MAPDMASTTPSWFQRAALLLPALLLVCGAAGAAVARGQRTHVGNAVNDEAAPLNPLAVLVLRALASEDAAPPGAVLEPTASNDDLAGLMDAAAVAAARAGASPSRTASVPDGDLGDTAFLRTAKRQVRYHQCYFNPISCFG